MMFVVGCTLEPAYLRPDLPVAKTWPDGAVLSPPPATMPNGSGMPIAAADIGWRDFFTDPALQRLIEIALINNRDARIAAINVAAAQAQYRLQRAELFPTIDASLIEDAERYPAGVATASGGGAGAGSSGGSSASGGGGGTVIRTFSASIGFTAYEIDVFGRLRSLNHEKLEEYFGYQETQRSAIISLVAEVANGYLSVLADQELLRVTEETLTSQNASYALVKRSYLAGESSRLDLRQAESTVDTAKANLALYRRQLGQDTDQLIYLLGAPIPADLPAGGTINQQNLLEELPAGLPSDLLARRPDVIAAEHNLIAANASIGAARAAFFPSISLTGNLGTASSELSGLFKDGSRSWTFNPTISLPLFAGGANIANLDIAKQQDQLYVARYEQTVQSAFQEVSDALIGRSTLDDQLEAELALVTADQDSYQLSSMLYKNGIDSYLQVLDAQRTFYTAEQQVVMVKLARLQNLVTLYKTLGGGWKSNSAPDPLESNGGLKLSASQR